MSAFTSVFTYIITPIHEQHPDIFFGLLLLYPLLRLLCSNKMGARVLSLCKIRRQVLPSTKNKHFLSSFLYRSISLRTQSDAYRDLDAGKVLCDSLHADDMDHTVSQVL